jgi:hypothetical protein
VRRAAPVLSLWIAAFTADQATGQRYSAVFGSLAIAGSALALFPALVRSLAALAAYGLGWIAFNLGRAVADGSPVTLAGPEWIAGAERALFGGDLPSATLQRWLPGGQVGDLIAAVAAAVHLSFFLAPFAVALGLWRVARTRFGTYALATVAGFALSVAGFALLPTAPPWLADPGDVERLVRGVLPTSLFDAGDGAGLWFEPNHLAALPSVHVMAAVLVALAARPWDGWPMWLGAAYAGAMSVAVVVLGEHHVLDVALGWAVGLAAWALAARATGRQVVKAGQD